MTLFSLDEATIIAAVRAISDQTEGFEAEACQSVGLGIESPDAISSTASSSTSGPAAKISGVNTSGANRPGANSSGTDSHSARHSGDTESVSEWAAERFARATWSGIAEPGDVAAGILVRALGAAGALRALVERHSPGRIRADALAAGAEIASDREVGLAIERWMPRLAANSALTSMRLAARCGARLLTPADDDWPARLSDLDAHEPLALWVRGAPGSLAAVGHSLALVGARAATGYGEHVAMELSAGLCDRGFGIVSGAAYGIDGMSHRAALASSGLTIAFLAGGVDRSYPSGHDSLLSRIASEGVIVSELPCGAPPTKWRFLQRNRLIAAVSQATIVIEAGARSGSLNTAAHAASMGRPLGAVPGPVTSAASAGCHRLLREFDAVCVTSADEAAELVTGDPAGSAGSPGSPGSESAAPSAERRHPQQLRVLDALAVRTSRSVEDIASRTGMSLRDTQSVLGTLSLTREVIHGEEGWKKTPASRTGPR
ncbi:DNA-processing protein DprA [Subtercola frigoramans]|uniref:DNA processing protein n=1 Tax=Subtercola frigoramans TaxID=120298 RepID=A0ABS2L7H9_9MICO|nr:DNA-processing protein DprA [Subtercola frigoramans]MBM7472836.1 DNA processing protein [Subtercola frigoramans]